MELSKSSIRILARQAGIKSLSDDCYENIRSVISEKLNEVIVASLIVNSEHKTKTLMPSDIYEALRLLGYNVTETTELEI